MPYKPPLSEPIAVVASSCRFTAGASSPSKLWDILQQPSDLSRTVPPSRFNVRAFYHPEGDYHGTTDAPKAYWLDDDADPRAFDAGFFGMAPKEAEAVDPQQRLLLETVYEALESAGYKLPDWAGKDVAVFVGAMTSDFDSMSQRDDLTTSPYYATGNARSILSNRISYFYDFRGPSATIDTACSSSLVALHQAVLSLRAGDCSAACVAGVNLMLAPEQFVVESSLHMLSPTGHCRMWDAHADGYARGEGAAVLLLKPLSQALADGDGDGARIQALIRETGVGSDGRTAGITMPSPEAQASLIRATYRRAGLDIADAADRCQYFEAHGTGTPVGDPREAQAIYSAFFGQARSEPTPLPMLVGSVKTVIGHTEGAAGLAGILKVMLAMKHAEVPPNLHLEQLNPQVAPFCTPSSQGRLQVVSTPTAWPAVPEGQPLRASVNSFGFGGTNAHAIVERYDPAIHTIHTQEHTEHTRPTPTSDLPQIPLLLSATSASSLRVLAARYLAFLQKLEDGSSPTTLQDVAWRALASRTPFLHRLSICASGRLEAIRALAALVEVSPHANELGSRARRAESRIIGIFTGQGAQWPGMSRGLFSNRIYRDAIRAMESVLQTCACPPSWTLEGELQKLDADSARVNEAAISQPLCTALQVGLVDILTSLGVQFACVVGHSSGEIAAAYAAKRLSARDAILIAYYRGLGVSGADSSTQGGMLAAGLSCTDAEAFCTQLTFQGRLCVAASNSPSSTTLSGDVDAVEEAERLLAGQGVFARRLLVDKAYHSHHMAALADKYASALTACQISPLVHDGTAGLPVWVSSVRPAGPPPSPAELAGPYWVDNMVNPVLFREAVETALTLLPDGLDCAIEVGPHPALRGPVTDTAQLHTPVGTKSNMLYTSLLRRGKDDAEALSEFLGFMWSQFDPCPVDFHGLLDAAEVKSLGNDETLPAYPWDHSQIYFRQSRIVRQFHHKQDAPHELLGSRTRDDVDGHELRWRNLLRVDKLPWLAHHAFQGQPLLPASAYCVMALDAAKALLAGRAASVVELEHMEFVSGIPLEVDGPATEVMFSLAVQTQTRSQPKKAASATDEQITARFSIYSTSEASETPMRKRCSGTIRIVLGDADKNALPSRSSPDEQPETFPVSVDTFYGMMAKLGLQYSGPFRAIETMRRRHNFASASLKRSHAQDSTGLSVSPATLDSCLQTCFAAFSSPGDKALWTAFLPIQATKITFNMAVSGGPSPTSQSEDITVDAELTAFHEPTSASPARITGDISIYNEAGDMEILIEGLTVGSLAATRPQDDRELYLHTVYAPDPEHSLVQAANGGQDDRILDEACERVVMFANASGNASSPTAWPLETADTLARFIASSPYASTLEKIRVLSTASGIDVQGCPYQSLLEEGRHVYQFQHHVAQVVKQMAHRYPRMAVFSLTDAEMGLSTAILRGLDAAFASYTSALLGPDAAFAYHVSQEPAHIAKKVRVLSLDQHSDVKAQLADDESASTAARQQPFDLAVLSTSIFKQTESSEAVLDHIKRLMRPGGFLILVHMPIKQLGDSPGGENIITPPDWPDLLDQRGFMNPAIKNTDQHYPGGFSITVRQSDSHFKKSLSQVAAPLPKNADEKLLVVGGRTAETRLLAASTSQLLAAHPCGPIAVVAGLDEIAEAAPDALSSPTRVVLLADLDAPVLSTINDQTLDALRQLLLRPGMTMLWVTSGARLGNAEAAASFGFARSVRAETPSLVLQMLDFDLTPTASGHDVGADADAETSAASVIATTFLQLLLGAEQQRKQDKLRPALHGSLLTATDAQTSHLWLLENEIFINSTGDRCIPRVVPYRPGNDTFNSSRRVVTTPVNTLSARVELVQEHASFRTRLPTASLSTDTSAVQVHYSSVYPIGSGFLCVGRDTASGDIVAAVSDHNASFVSVPRGQSTCLSPPPPGSLSVYTGILARMLLCHQLCRECPRRQLVLVAPDELMLHCANIAAAAHGCDIVSIQVTDSKPTQSLSLHSRATAAQIKATLRRLKDGARLVDFLPLNHAISQHIVRSISTGWSYQSESQWGQGVSESQGLAAADAIADDLRLAVSDTDSYFGQLAPFFAQDLVSVPVLLRLGSQSTHRLSLIDWRAERTVAHRALPLDSVKSTESCSAYRLRGDRTYVLIGITRDMGQSLATLLVKQGACHVVLASRSAVTQMPAWARQLSKLHGVAIRFETLNVTDLAAVRQFRVTIEQTMPPVGGVVNGAMVLQDRVFTQMAADTFSRVMRPKTVGSQNLDTVFRDDSSHGGQALDFFIMTSSFAAVGGHAGQSNYAAANMFMNGIAADRQRRGAAASVMNIGVIYGLGFLHREKDGLYAGLEREGYPPISERDLHHMFLEAIRIGRPKQAAADRHRPIVDLTCGLDRFDPSQPADVALHWHTDPRFSHFTIQEEGDGTAVDAQDKPGCTDVSSAKALTNLIAQGTASADDIAQQLVAAFVDRLAALLQLGDGGSRDTSIHGDSSLVEVGVDSLVAVESRTWLWRTTGRDVPVMRILGAASINKLCMGIAQDIVASRGS